MPITCLILGTGSRTFHDRRAVRITLLAQLTEWDVTAGEVGLLQGGAAGADTLCAEEAAALGLYVAPSMKPDWDTCATVCKPRHRRTRPDGTTYCPTAGLRRNQEMVDRVVAFLTRDPGHRARCLVFRTAGVSNGTDHCTTRAMAARIQIRRPSIIVPELA